MLCVCVLCVFISIFVTDIYCMHFSFRIEELIVFYYYFRFLLLGGTMGRRKKRSKRRKASKPKPTVVVDDEEEEDTNMMTVKTGLKNILRPRFRNVLTKAISEKSIEATKLCSLASLLFLNKVQNAYDSNHEAFFRQNGENVIRDCFYAVLPKNLHTDKMTHEFREIAQRLDEQHQISWPNTEHFGNAIKDLIDTYVTNVKTNLSTHSKKRLREYLRMKIYERNRMVPLVIRYEEQDIDHAIAWAIFGTNSIDKDDPDRVAKRMRRGMLLKMIADNSWFDIGYGSIGKFTKIHWFKSIQFWIALQRQLDAFNTSEEYREQRRLEREHFRYGKCQREQSSGHCKCGLTKKGPPKVCNLKVIPICAFTRTHYTLDNFTFYQLLCSVGIVPQTHGIRKEYRNIKFNEFMQHKEFFWNKFFIMRKINWFVRWKKKFRFRILSDGQAVSLAYDVDKKQAVPIEIQRNGVVCEYENRKIKNESGTDPGVNTWMATTLRTIETGKEVSKTLLLSVGIPTSEINLIFLRSISYRLITRLPASNTTGGQKKTYENVRPSDGQENLPQKSKTIGTTAPHKIKCRLLWVLRRKTRFICSKCKNPVCQQHSKIDYVRFGCTLVSE